MEKQKIKQDSLKYSFCDGCGHYKHFLECIEGMQYSQYIPSNLNEEIFHRGLVGILCNKSSVLGSFLVSPGNIFTHSLICFIYLLLHDKILSQWEFSSIHELNESLGLHNQCTGLASLQITKNKNVFIFVKNDCFCLP